MSYARKALLATTICASSLIYASEESKLKALALVQEALVNYMGSEKSEPDWKKATQNLKAILKLSGDEVEIRAAKISARSLLGSIFFAGLHGAKQNWKHAITCFTKVAKQDEFPAEKTEAQLKLGIIYHIGNEQIDRDVAKAEEYLHYAANQKEFTEIAAVANLRLAVKHLVDDADISEAQSACKKALELTKDPTIKEQAEGMLGEIDQIVKAIAEHEAQQA